MRHLPKSTHVFFQAHSGVDPIGICSSCADWFNNSQHSYWDFTSPISESTFKPLNKTCAWCKRNYWLRAWEEGRILWHVWRNGEFLFSTTDRKKAFQDKAHWREYERRTTILK